MSRYLSSRWLALALSLAFAVFTTAPAAAGDENLNVFQYRLKFDPAFGWIGQDDPGSEFRLAANPSAIARSAIFRLNNSGASFEPGEPTQGGKMKKTVWAKLTPPQSQRVVIHTFGSDFNTVLAVYTGQAVNALKLVSSNDDRTAPGLGSTHSLVQFNAIPDKQYNVQVGSKTGAEGDIFAAVFVFPPTGGLSAFMATVGGAAWNSRDYVCNNAHVVACGNPRFILHNSTNKTLTVTASSNIGSGVTAPGQFTIGPGQIKTAEFTFTAAFNKTTTRTVVGHFTFVGRDGATEVTRAQHRALIVVGNATVGNVLRATVTPTVRAGGIGEAMPFDVKLTNTGSQTAIGCHARHDSSFSSRLKVTWRGINPSNGQYIGPLNQPFNIAAGQPVSFRAFVASQQSQLADPEFPTPVTLDCANTEPAPINLSNAFDLTALGIYRPVQVDVAKLAPSTDTLLVPAAGGVFRVSAMNRSATTSLRALAIYARPFDECCVAPKQFKVTICQLASRQWRLPCAAIGVGHLHRDEERDEVLQDFREAADRQSGLRSDQASRLLQALAGPADDRQLRRGGRRGECGGAEELRA